MFIPINWFYIHQSWKEKKYNHFYLWLSSLSLLLISLLFSYGRVVITLGFIEILLLGSFSIKSFLKKKKWRVLYLLILTIFIGMVGSKIIIGALEKESRNQLCEIVYDTDNNFKTCKRFDLNSRIDYWKTSVIAIKKNPLFGYGPGTYSLINSRYKIKPESSTAYAHNAFLQIFAESGVIVFLVFSSLMILGLWKVIKISFKDLLINKKNIFGNLSLNKSIAIGLTAIYIDVLFDFDWSLLSIYLITLMLTAIVLGSKSKKTIKNIKKRQFIIFTKILYLFCSFTIISIVVINLIIESLIFSNNSNTAVKVFPYFHSHIKLLALNKNLSPDSKEKLMKVYQYDSSYYSFSNQNEMLLKYSNEIKKIDPWYYYSRGILINIDPKFEKEIERELMLTGQAFSDAKKYGSLGNIESNKELSVLASNIGDMYLRKNDLKNAAVFYKLSLDFHQWAWNEVKPLFVSHNFSISEQLTFWDEMNYVEPKSFATYQFPVAKSFQVLADYDFERKNWDDLLIKVEYMGEVAHWVKSDYLRLKEKDLQDEADLMIEKGDNYSAIKILEIMSKSTTEYWSIVQLANYYVLSNEDDKAMNAFQECNIVWKKYNNDEEHDACFYGMRSLEKGTIDRGNYYNVSNTIKNNLL
ncbi:MAG: O-antigen ligase family protein [Candidatus Pacebacteria bacterium]|nr:O-antigen ligase family protein [Candidatus Paceibacterota bacterium]